MKNLNFANYRFAAFIALVIVFLISVFYLRNQMIGEVIAANHHPEKSEVSTHDWPQWRGVNRDGVSLERNLLTNCLRAGQKSPGEFQLEKVILGFPCRMENCILFGIKKMPNICFALMLLRERNCGNIKLI